MTFNYSDANAKDVKLSVQFLPGQQQMTRNERGVWTITVGPAAPDMYPYCFVVDGVNVMDPLNPDWFPNEGFKNCIVDIRGTGEPLVHSLKNVPHGSVDYVNYWSETLGVFANAIVYTPPFYDRNRKEKYPVFYLISGTTDTEEVYFKVGRMNLILDNLIAQGLAKRMIVVMPYANPYPELILQGKAESANTMDTDLITSEIVNDVIPFIESNYKVRKNARNRAVAGFSLGGRQSLACGLGNPDKFRWVCAYAPAVFGNEYETNFENGTYAPLKVLKKKLKLMWLGTGSEDFLIQASRGLDEYLDKNGLKHTFYTPGGGHTWMNCRDYIELTARELFK